MPKRPCAVTLTPDEKTILCGDKFGDVYALPLHPTEADNYILPPYRKLDEDHESRSSTLVPSANTRTVHTLRNQKALKDQLSSANRKVPPKAPTFENQLLLGHVSLLTDVACVAVSGEVATTSHDRTYIITADRDEHIRVSRGMPQAHVIEGFCLGHTQFVSKLCVPSWDPRLLVSGGGDDHLVVWDWLAGRILQRFDLRKHVSDFIDHYYDSPHLLGHDPMDRDTVHASHTKIAVRELHAAEARTTTGAPRRYIVVVIEGYATPKSCHRSLANVSSLAYQLFFCSTLLRMARCSKRQQLQRAVTSLR